MDLFLWGCDSEEEYVPVLHIWYVFSAPRWRTSVRSLQMKTSGAFQISVGQITPDGLLARLLTDGRKPLEFFAELIAVIYMGASWVTQGTFIAQSTSPCTPIVGSTLASSISHLRLDLECML